MPLTSHDPSVARWCGCLAAMARSTKHTSRTSGGVSPATLNHHQGDTVGEHEFVTMLSPWWSLLAS